MPRLPCRLMTADEMIQLFLFPPLPSEDGYYTRLSAHHEYCRRPRWVVSTKGEQNYEQNYEQNREERESARIRAIVETAIQQPL